MHFKILGPLAIADGDETSTVGILPTATKKQVLLAYLLARVGEVVPTVDLMDEVWAEQQPRKARPAMHVYVAQLRSSLAQGTVLPSTVDRAAVAPRIVTRGPGYALHLGDARLDQHDFEGAMGAARHSLEEGRPEEAAEHVAGARSLWRGPALAGLNDGRMLATFATYLDEQYAACLELAMETDLRLGRHRELIGELTRLIHQYPLREAFYRQLMLAYYRSERQADALTCFHELRGQLQEELGVDPCRTVQRLHQAMLTADPVLEHYDAG